MNKAVRRGPRPSGSDTRADIRAAATDLFGEHGYEAVSLRMVAREAGVDPALVTYYFDSKAELFEHAMRPVLDPDRVEELIGSLTTENCGHTIVAFVLDLWGDELTARRMAGTVAAANSQEAESDFMRGFVLDAFLLPIAHRLSPDEPELRATLAATVLLGALTCASTLRMPMMDGLSDARLTEILGTECRRLLVGELPVESDPAGIARKLDARRGLASGGEEEQNQPLQTDEGEGAP
ncbi:TetR/AcrR family transcriptional regulator [Kytococcus sp. Marseille-QA3725]